MKSRMLGVALFGLALSLSAGAQEKKDPPVPGAGNVTIPLEEYNHMLELASKPIKKPELPPVPYVLSCAELKFGVKNDTVVGKLEIEGEVYSKNATKVPLTNGITIFDAHREGKTLAMLQEGGTHVAVLPGASPFNVILDAGLPLQIEAGRASFYLPAPAAGSVNLTLTVPGEHTNVRIAPGLITNRSSENGQTTIEATLQPGQPASVWWTTREVAAPVVPREVRFLSDVKTLVTVSEAEQRIAMLADINVVQGDPSQFELKMPEGYEMTGATGATIESTDEKAGVLTIKVANPAVHSHQFLITLERSLHETKTDAPFLSFQGAQRETGEILVEGAGTIELTAKESGGLQRMDIKEVNPYLRSLARYPMQAAFRFHRQPNDSPALALEWTRFPDSSVLAAVAERAIVTTLVTNEGKSLTEVKLLVKNQAQPFLKVTLPQGASILSAEVAGEKVKPVEGADGSRVPLLRAGFRPNGAYEVSYVFMHSGAPFAKKGGSEIGLPKMDVPINVLQWEVFLPEMYKVKDFGGDAMAASLLPWLPQDVAYVGAAGGTGGGIYAGPISLGPGQLGGYMVDSSGAVIPNVQVTVTHIDTGTTRITTTDGSGKWIVSNIPPGRVRIAAHASGFRSLTRDLSYDGQQPSATNFKLDVGAVAETVTVEASSAALNYESRRFEKDMKKQKEQAQMAASVNVYNLQKRVSGVLPVRVDVPRAGNSYRFVRPLVLDEETKVSFTYKSK